MYAGEYASNLDKKVKVVYLPTPAKKGLVSRSVKPKSTKRGDNSSKTCFDIVSYEGGLPPIGKIVLKGSSPPVGKPRSSTPRPSMDAPSSSRTCGSKRMTTPPPPFATSKRRVCYLQPCFFFFLFYSWGFLVANSECILMHLPLFFVVV